MSAAQTGPNKWTLGVGVAFAIAVGLVLLFLLTQATDNSTLYERYYGALVGLNIAAASALGVVIVWLLVKLWQRWRQGKFGSQLLVKLVLIFGLLGLIPGALIYVVSYQFVTRSIESWFDVRVEGALNAGLNLGRNTLDLLSSDLGARTAASATELASQRVDVYTLQLERLREQLRATDVAVLSGTGQVVASAGASQFSLGLGAARPSSQRLQAARQNGVTTWIDGLDDGTDAQREQPADATSQAFIRAVAWLTPNALALKDESRYLQVSVPLSPTLAADALAVQQANREYQERALARDGLRSMYIGTLTLALVLTVFGAVLVAALLGNQLAKPLLVLAAGVRDVAKGDLTPKLIVRTRDELGGLTRSFADMTQQLADARAAVQLSVSELDAARASLQTILDNLTAGVMVLDAGGHIQSINPSAQRILGDELLQQVGQPLAGVAGLQEWAHDVGRQFKRLSDDQAATEQITAQQSHWQHSYELQANAHGLQHDTITLLARGALLPGLGQLLVFDDISDLVSAQRAKAWADVARRLAHEIKNPLTPIQLSAERLSMKLDGKLQPAEQALVTKSVNTIVAQVEAMKRLVNEFRDYARLPAAVLHPLDLNAVVRDILSLYENAVVPVQFDAQPNIPLIEADDQQLRQVIHNLVQNAQDASLANEAVRKPLVVLRTRLNEQGDRLRLQVLDSGAGFTDAILKRAFEPYVTTKTKGTGLGLAVVKKIADEHHAQVHLKNRLEAAHGQDLVAGGQVSVSFPVV
ncbi:ATP-binding protein [Comamonadaceae bacterium M7527]|nr:ATP-binding protein [Comamonadaceae bacterium M7527]